MRILGIWQKAFGWRDEKAARSSLPQSLDRGAPPWALDFSAGEGPSPWDMRGRPAVLKRARFGRRGCPSRAGQVLLPESWENHRVASKDVGGEEVGEVRAGHLQEDGLDTVVGEEPLPGPMLRPYRPHNVVE